MDVLACALRYLRAGISVLPIATDGSKRPAVEEWKSCMRELAGDRLARQWWEHHHPPGIAAVCGAVSGNLEVIDFDREAQTIFPLWHDMVEEASPGLLDHVAIVQTPRQPPGYHVWFRCPDFQTPGNLKLAALSASERAAEREAASREARKAEYTLIETRGEGGYALVPGCPACCHASGALYEHIEGAPLTALPDLTVEGREILLACARFFNRDLAAPEPIPRSSPGNDLRPGDDFDKNGWDWGEILQAHGWVCAFGSPGGERRWRRPGKSQGWSATTGHCSGSDGADVLRVFSGNADPFEEGKCYGKFRAFALLNHSGDLKAAAKALAGLGFGAPAATGPARSPKMPDVHEQATATDEEENRSVATIGDLARAGAAVSWLCKGWIPRGVVVAIASEAGTGKTRFCADLMRRIRHGLPWPDGQDMSLPADSRALWVVSDNHHDEMVTLCRDFGIEDNVFLNAWADDPYGGVALDAHEDFRDLELRIQKVKPTFVIVDTVGNATDRNLSKQEDARAFYLPLQVLARRYRTTVLAVTHLNTSGKFLGRRVLEKVRVALRMEKPDPDDPRRVLEVYKSFGKKPEALGMTMGDQGNEYDNNPPKAPVAFEPGMAGRPGVNGQQSKASAAITEAVEWLSDRLKNGRARVSDLRSEGEAKGYSTGTIYRAKEALSIVETLDNGRKWWSLPASDEVTTPWD